MKLIQQKIITIAGLWLIVLPFTGFPRSWKTLFTVVTGMVVAYIGALMWKRASAKEKKPEVKTDTFTQVV